mgnify:CR=1 FL=1
MFSNKDWLRDELQGITRKINQVATDMSAMKQDVKNIQQEHHRHDKRLEVMDDRVRRLENTDIADSAKWN